MRKFSNNASSTLASGIIAADGSLTIESADAGNFPSPSGGDYAIGTIEDVDGNIEIVHMTARAGTLCTITRAQEGTTALDFDAGSRFEIRITSAALTAFLQKDGDSITGEIAMTGAGALSGGKYEDGQVVNSPLRGDAGVNTNQVYVPPGGGAPVVGTTNQIYHQGNLTQAVIGSILFPVGAIIMWYGDPGDIPDGWALCDGTGGTPNLENRFIVGAGDTYALGATGGAASVTSDGGNLSLTINGTALTAAQLPAHTHFIAADVFSSSSTEIDATNVADRGTTAFSEQEYRLVSSGAAATVGKSSSVGSGDTHTHTVSGESHTHEVATLPPYFGLYFIMKV